MRCIVCDSTDKWENVDQFRMTKKGMMMCGGCGFISYPGMYKTEAEIKAHYKEDYRKCPSVQNAFTGQKKLHIHSAFLTDTLKSWMDRGLKNPVVCDIGAAYGQFLNWIKSHFPEADISGTEWALAYRRNAWHEYGIRLDLDFDRSKKYHLISSFKVAEHQLDVDLRLREYVECLHEDGFMYISVPIWHEKMVNPGTDGFDLEFYYDPHHINVWHPAHFEYLLAKVGLEIVKKDLYLYDNTYLCKRNDALMADAKIPKIDPEKLKAVMKRIKTAAILYGETKFEEALREFSNFPAAWVNAYEQSRQKAHAARDTQPPFEWVMENFVAPMLKACPTSLEPLRLAGDVCMRYDKYQDAAKYIQKALELRPNNASFLMALSHCFREIALRATDPADKLKMFVESRDCVRYLRDIDLQSRNDAVNWIYKDNSMIPTPHEGGTHG